MIIIVTIWLCNILVTRHDFTTHSLSYKIVQFGAKNREDGIEWQIKEVRCCRIYNDHVYSGHVYRDVRQQIYLSRGLVSGQNYQVCRHSHPSTISQVIKYYESDIGFMSRK